MPPATTDPDPGTINADALLDELDAQVQREANLQVFAALHNSTLAALVDQPKVCGREFQMVYEVTRIEIARGWQVNALYTALLERYEAMPADTSPRLLMKVRNTLSFVRFGDNRRGRKTTVEVKS